MIVALLAASRLWSPGSGAGVSWVIALFDIWLIVSSFIWAYGSAPAVGAAATTMVNGLGGALNAHWNDIVVGAIILILGLWAAIFGRGATTPRPTAACRGQAPPVFSSPPKR